MTDMIEKSLAIAAMLRFMVSYVKYTSELPSVQSRISLSRGSNTIPIKNMVATKVIRSTESGTAYPQYQENDQFFETRGNDL